MDAPAGLGRVGFRQVADTLRAAIAAGEYPPGGRLPKEADLSARFACSRDTVRDALAVLVAEGHLVKQRGERTTVRDRPDRTVVHLPPGATVTARPITLQEADSLGCGPGVAVLEVRVGDDEPVRYRGDRHTLVVPP